ncbi:hypothetical protein AS189_07200 [Arthrobacter alpinus]|uniref:Uncharacterized protein n=1 Tax=Arthrobacter alpinus TaxID=656366 RepID=A0A0S2LY52_9MICC|nr:hypothetical protein [Arthrobacter alpinus]ALO66316.1 hypothetical protein AS189_07200 [Arthrobacter alpinus]
MARMIYHVPYPLNPEGKSGSALRPMRMLEAFREIGYEVELVSGESKQRRALIKALKARITQGRGLTLFIPRVIPCPRP